MVVDAHRLPLNLHALKLSGTLENFGSGGASAGASVFDVAAGQGGTFSVDNVLKITEGNTQEINTVIIKSIVVDTITIDRPLEKDYTSAGVVEIVDTDVSNANGTIGAPVVYQVLPPSNKVYYIHGILLYYEDGPEPGIDLFSGIAALTNGLIIRVETVLQGNFNLVLIRTNGDMKEYFGGHEVEFVQKSGGGDYSINGIWHMKEHTDAVIRLNGAVGDSLKFIYQDNITDITLGQNVIQGHIEDI